MDHSLASYLVQQRVLTPAQIDEATQAQVVFGGSLGTNLVELGYLNLDQLAMHLCASSGLAPAPRPWLERPQPEALAAVPRKLVESHKVLPMRLEGRVLHVAFAEPVDPRRVDEVAFASGLRVKPYLLPELRLYYELERHFGIRREVRYINLGRDASKGRFAREQTPDAVTAAHTRRPATAGEDLMDEASFAALTAGLQYGEAGGPASGEAMIGGPASGEAAVGGPEADVPELGDEDLEPIEEPEPQPAPAQPAQAQPAPPQPAPAPAEPAPPPAEATAAPDHLAALALHEQTLAAAETRDSVIDSAVGLARGYARASALFLVHQGMIEGLRGSGGDLEERVTSVFVPLGADSVLAKVAADGAPRVGPVEGGIDTRLLRALGRTDVETIAVLPVKIRDRVVNLLYADFGPEPIPGTCLAALKAVADAMSAAYEQLILAQKRAQS